MSTETNAAMEGPNIIINELLCWVISMIGVLDVSPIIQYSIEKCSEADIKTARDTLYNLVITDKEKPEFGKRIKFKTGDSSSVKWMNEIYKICQEYTIDNAVFVARELSKLPVIAYEGFADMSGVVLGLKRLEIEAGLSKE